MRVFLRSLEPNDYKTSVAWRHDEAVASLVSGPKHFVSAELEREWVLDRALQRTDDVTLAVCLREDESYIGNVSLKNIDWIARGAESSILIGATESWGRGLGEEALRLLLDFAFDERGLERLYALVLADNERSLKLHEKCGYKREGLLRKSVFKQGRFRDQHLLAILRSEFEEARRGSPGS